MFLRQKSISDETIIINPFSNGRINLQELWAQRDLLYFFILRNIKVRYRQTILGVFWVVIQPIVTVLIFTFFFGRMLGFAADGVSYPVFVFSGLIPWLYFSQGLLKGSNSLVGQASVIKKVYFPRLMIPISEILAGIPDFLIGMGAFLCLTLSESIYPTFRILLFPLAFAHLTLVCIGISLWLSSINVVFRDIQQAVTFLVQILMFVSPIIYPVTYVSPFWEAMYSLNPMVGTIECFRWIFLGTTPLTSSMMLSSISIGYLILFSGLYFFKRMEIVFADVV